MEAIKSPYARLAWNHLTEKDEHDKFSCALYLPKNTKALDSVKGLSDTQKQQLVDGVEAFRKNVMATVDKEKTAKAFKSETLFKDGDEKADAAVDTFKAENPGKEVPAYCNFTRNMWVINLKSMYQPDFYGPKASEGKLGADWASENIYAGCWVRADVRDYNWNYQGKKGYSLGLGGMVQKWTDDSSFEASSSGGSEVDDALEISPTATADDFLD